MSTLLQRLHYPSWLALPIILIFIFYISSIPREPIPIIKFPYKAILYHFGIFLILTITSMIAFSRGGKDKDFAGLAILFSLCYAITDEIHQLLVPGRRGSFGDVITDAAGIAFGAALFWILNKNKVLKR